MPRILQAFVGLLALLAAAATARADFTFTQGTGQTGFSFTAATGGTSLCAASVTHCFASVPIDTAGAQLFATGNAGFVRAATGSFASGSFASGSHASGSFASGAFASGSVASGAIASGAMVDVGAQADAACGTATGTCSLIALTKYLNTAVNSDVPSVTGPLAAATAAATKSLMVGGQFLTTQPTMTNTQQASLLFSPRGAVYVMTGAEKLLVTPDSVALPANQSVNVAQMNGVTPLMGDGVTGTGSPRFTLATNGSALTTAGFMSVKLDQTTDGTTNSVSAHGAVNVTPTNCDGTITAGGTAQNAHTAQAALRGMTIANLDTTEVMWISFTTTAAAADTKSYPLAPATATTFAGLSSYTTPLGFGYNTALSVIAATTGHKFACTRW